MPWRFVSVRKPVARFMMRDVIKVIDYPVQHPHPPRQGSGPNCPANAGCNGEIQRADPALSGQSDV